MPKTFSIKASEVSREWVLVDASKIPLGRVATEVSKLLVGKHKPTYSPNIDGGDNVIVINSDKVKLTGNKLDQKMYYRHSGYPGNLKSLSAKQIMQKDSTRLVKYAVKGMLPKNKLQSARLKRLRVFKNDKHTYQAQKPREVSPANA